MNMAGHQRAEITKPAVAAWLGAGAITLGIGAALTAGAAVAGASTDESGVTSGPASSAAGHTNATADATQAHSHDASPTAKKKPRHQTEGKPAASAATGSDAKPATPHKRTVVTHAAKAVAEHDDDTATAAVQSTPSSAAAAPKVATVPKVAAVPTAKTTAKPANPLVTLNQAVQSFLHNVQATYFNTPPKITGYTVPVENSDGTYSGHVTVVDKDGDPLTYSAYPPFDGGAVTVDEDGNYTYTPSGHAPTDPETGAFYVNVVEANAYDHYHGINQIFAKIVEPVLLKALGPNAWPPYSAPNYARAQQFIPGVPWGNTDPSPTGTTSTLATARATAAPPATPAVGSLAWFKKTFANTAPKVTVSTPIKNADGTYTGQVTTSDADGDPLTIEYSATQDGTTTLSDHGDGTYTFTYTPSESAATTPNFKYYFYVSASEANAASHFHSFEQIVIAIAKATLGNFLRAIDPGYRHLISPYDPLEWSYGSAGVTIPVGPVVPPTST
jgi:hypothetical protein